MYRKSSFVIPAKAGMTVSKRLHSLFNVLLPQCLHRIHLGCFTGWEYTCANAYYYWQ
jgi:hypothetical protein